MFMLQRGSPYLEDANEVITLAREIGLIDAQFRNGWFLQLISTLPVYPSVNDLLPRQKLGK